MAGAALEKMEAAGCDCSLASASSTFEAAASSAAISALEGTGDAVLRAIPAAALQPASLLHCAVTALSESPSDKSQQ